MKIGIDVSMEVNRSEGYLMMEYKKRGLFTKGKLNPDASCRFFAHYPDYVREGIWGTANPIGESTILTDVNLNANELWEMYQSDKKGIDSFIGASHRFPTNEYEMLNLASDIRMYCGLE